MALVIWRHEQHAQRDRLTIAGIGSQIEPCRISLVAPVRGDMTVDDLRAAQIQAAHDILTAALLSLESGPKETVSAISTG